MLRQRHGVYTKEASKLSMAQGDSGSPHSKADDRAWFRKGEGDAFITAPHHHYKPIKIGRQQGGLLASISLLVIVTLMSSTSVPDVMRTVERVTLNTGATMPVIGLGTWKSAKSDVKAAVRYALEHGYRHVDCAYVYFNEVEVGEALEEVFASESIRRSDVFVTSKLWSSEHRPEDVEAALDNTLRDLKLEYLDLYLMHWPVALERGQFKPEDGPTHLEDVTVVDTYKAMEALLVTGKVKAIGVSNFGVQRLQNLLGKVSVVPSVNQVESHPYLPQEELRRYCQDHGIVMTAYCPIGSPGGAGLHLPVPTLVTHPDVLDVAKRARRSPAQVLLRWHIQRGVTVIPKSVSPAHIDQNLDIWDFELDPTSMDVLSRLAETVSIPVRYVDGKTWLRRGETLEDFWA
mmetsp:Transcript_8527/g.31502  ORF Transcript_8527/g.31502 Transcript_8527/m.31502 type:complete len:403 (-) Transcript_8527:361-1569(-)